MAKKERLSMNQVILIGRLTKDVETRYTQEQMAVSKFTLAVDRIKKGETDFIRVTVFGKQAENCERYLHKGSQCAVQGRLQTGSYEKDGVTHYTTDVIADRVQFLGGQRDAREDELSMPEQETFQEIKEDIP